METENYTRNDTAFALQTALMDTRTEPGLSLKDIANEIKGVLDPEEIRSLIKELA